MTVKRRSHGRNKKGRGHVNRVRCASTGKAIPKDKAIKRFIVRNIVDASSMRDIRDASAFETYALPKITSSSTTASRPPSTSASCGPAAARTGATATRRRASAARRLA